MQTQRLFHYKKLSVFLWLCVLSLVGFAQVQIGANLYGQSTYSLVGVRLGFSSDGTRVVLSNRNYSGTVLYQGRVQVFEDINGVWTQVGSNIDGQVEDQNLGAGVALSGDGTTVAAYGNDSTKIYKNISGVWTKQGTTIFGRMSSLPGSIALSADGSIFAIGNEDYIGNMGSCTIYQWNGTAWTQLGATILGNANERIGKAVDISSDGLTIVCTGTSGRGKAKVYEFVAGAWQQKGTTIVGDNAVGQEFGYSTSLSADGTVVAIGARTSDGPTGTSSDLGMIRVYKWQSGTWTQLGAAIYGDITYDRLGQSLALSADGTVLAGGAYSGDNLSTGIQGGWVKRYRWVGSFWMLENTIYGEQANEEVGWTTAISADGNRIAVGAPQNDDVAEGAGRVAIFGFCSPPTAYNLTGGGYSCNGTGVVVGLADSDVGVEYQLMRGVPNVSNPVNVGSPVAGTGNAISFGAQTISGDFIVKANNLTTSCSGFMSGSVAATIENANVMPTISIVSNDLDNTIWATESVTFTATATNGGFFPVYQWKKNGTDVGTSSPTYTDANLANNDIITCELTSSNSCATTPNVTSNSLSMTVNQSPAGAALHFDGSNDYVQLPAGLGTALSAANNTAITLEYWFKGASIQSAIRLQEVNDPGNFIVAGWGGKHIISTDGGINGINVGSNVTDGNWHHVAMTWQRNTINGFRSYLDGVLVEQRNAADVNLPLVENGLAIGAHSDFWYTEEHTNGTIDEVRMWNRALTQCEIQNNMSCELASGQTGLVAYYQFNQGLVFLNNSSITTLTDASGNGFNATLTNFALTGTTSNWVSGGAVTSGLSCTAPIAAISIVSDDADNVITTGTSVTFTATPTNGGSSPVYQWKKNGINVGTNSATYTDAGLVDNDMILCILISDASCLSSNSATSTVITMTVTPPCAILIPYAVTGGGAYCEGGVGFAVGLVGSESGVTYQLQKDNVDEGSPVNGTGSAISFGTKTAAGTYTVVATTTSNCITNMTGNAVITINPVPPANAIPSVTASNNNPCAGTSVILTATAPAGFVGQEYLWYKNGTAVNYVNGGAGVYTVNVGSVAATNDYTLKMVYAGYVCLSNSSASNLVATRAPQATITPNGPTSFCANTPTMLNANTGMNTYTWRRGSTIVQVGGTSYIPTATGNYTLMVKDAYNCSKVSAATSISVKPQPVANAGADKSACLNNSIQIGAASVAGNTYTWLPSTGLSNPFSSNPTLNANVSGTYTYTVSVSNANTGCSKSDAMIFTAISGPATPSVTKIVIGTTITLKSTTPGAASVNWYRNGLLLHSNMAPNSSINVLASNPAKAYTVKSKGTNGCLSSFSNFVTAKVGDGKTGDVLVEIDENVMQAYPNPTNGLLNVLIQNNELTDGKLLLYNHLGQVVLAKEISFFGGNANIVLDLKHLAAGVYSLSFENKVIKVVKE